MPHQTNVLFCLLVHTDPRNFAVQPPQIPPPHTVVLPQSLVYKMSSEAFSRPLFEPMASAWKEGEVRRQDRAKLPVVCTLQK